MRKHTLIRIPSKVSAVIGLLKDLRLRKLLPRRRRSTLRVFSFLIVFWSRIKFIITDHNILLQYRSLNTYLKGDSGILIHCAIDHLLTRASSREGGCAMHLLV